MENESSDDIDAMKRLLIQEGTFLSYLIFCMGVYASVFQNYTVRTNTPFGTREHVSLGGSLDTS